MTHSAAISQLSSDFNDFLFAPIAEDSYGTSLSVLSALARSNVDPWQEAAQLAALPRQAAIERLARLIAELPGGTPARPGPATNTASLIELLPRRKGPAIVTREGLFAVGAKPNSVTIAYVVLMVVVLGAQWVFAMHQQPAEMGSIHAPASGNAASRIPLSSADQPLSDGRGHHEVP